MRTGGYERAGLYKQVIREGGSCVTLEAYQL